MLNRIKTWILIGQSVTVKSIVISFFLSSLYSCSDNFNPAGNSENIMPGSGNSVNLSVKKTLLWENNGINIYARGERLVNSEVIAEFQCSRQKNLLISFDACTNADTTSYVSQLTVENGQNVLLLEGGEMYINRHHDIILSDSGIHTIRFYISLWCDEIEFNSSAKLCISNLKVYSY